MRHKALALALLCACAAGAMAENASRQPTYVSLASDQANGRRAPAFNAAIDYIYERKGLPLEILETRGIWARVRDPDGAEVWMHAANLSTRRTVLTLAPVALRSEAGPAGRTTAVLAQGVTASPTACDGDWLRVTVAGRVGWARRAQFWGAETCAGL